MHTQINSIQNFALSTCMQPVFWKSYNVHVGFPTFICAKLNVEIFFSTYQLKINFPWKSGIQILMLKFSI